MYALKPGDRAQAQALADRTLAPARVFVTVAVPDTAAGLCADLAALEPQLADLEKIQHTWHYNETMQATIETVGHWRRLLLAALSGALAADPPTCCVCGGVIVESPSDLDPGTDDAGTFYGPGWAFDLAGKQWYHGACADL